MFKASIPFLFLLSSVCAEEDFSELKYDSHRFIYNSKPAKAPGMKFQSPLQLPLDSKIYIDPAINETDLDKLTGELIYKPKDSPLGLTGNVKVDRDGSRSAGIGFSYEWDR